MKTEELDKRIGMPDIDAEWAKFEKEVIAPQPPKGEGIRKVSLQKKVISALPKGWTARAAAIVGIVFLSCAAIASAVIVSKPSKFTTLFMTEDNDSIYNVVDENPQYAGGVEGLMTYLMKELHYPQVAQDYGVYGRVLVQFVVEKDGRCTQFKAVKEVTSHQKLIKRDTPAAGSPQDRDYITVEEFKDAQKACTDEALRVCRKMNRWTPGKIKGKPVRTRFTLPITFRLK